MMNQIKKFFTEDSGQGMTEYGLILALLAVIVIGVMALFGPKVTTLFDSINLSPTQTPGG